MSDIDSDDEIPDSYIEAYDGLIYDDCDNDYDKYITKPTKYCICDKTKKIHYIIASKILNLQEYIHIPKYECKYCYDEIEKKGGMEFHLNLIRNIYYLQPINILNIKNKYGHTPLELIKKFKNVIKFELNCPYQKCRTLRSLKYSDYCLSEIKKLLINENHIVKYNRKIDVLCCASKFEVQLPPEIWMKIFEYL